MTGIYLISNGTERFLIEHIRVNNLIPFFGMQLTQAELISSALIIAGAFTIIFVLLKNKPGHLHFSMIFFIRKSSMKRHGN